MIFLGYLLIFILLILITLYLKYVSIFNKGNSIDFIKILFIKNNPTIQFNKYKIFSYRLIAFIIGFAILCRISYLSKNPIWVLFAFVVPFLIQNVNKNIKSFWFIFGIVLSLFEIVSFYQYYRMFIPIDLFHISKEIITIIAIIGIFYYSIGKKLFHKAFWQFILIILTASTIFDAYPIYYKYLHFKKYGAPECLITITFLSVLVISLIYGLTLYVFKSEDIWNSKMNKKSNIN
jgi:hypothetical protein